jgi:hypothetical protein
MVWPTEVTGLTSIGFEANGSYHFLNHFRRPGKADGSYLTGQNRRKKLIYVGFSLTYVGLWPMEISVITVVNMRD